MANRELTALVPAQLDPDAVHLSPVGEILIDRYVTDKDGKLTPTLYIALMDPVTQVKNVYLAAGAGKYDLIEHLARAHIIGNTPPTEYDRSSIWYNTEMVYVEPSDVTKSYISVRVEKSPGVWAWEKILPYTSFENVIIGTDSSGNPQTLKSVIQNNRIIYNTPINVREASFGELYLNDRNELYYKMGPNPEDQHLVGIVNTFLRDQIVELIRVAETAPLNWNYNTIWFTDDGDVSLSRKKYISFVDQRKSTGLKFTPDAQNRLKSTAVISNEGKVVTIDNNTTGDFGHIWTNYPFNENGKFYFEIYIEDPQERAQLIFLSDGKQQPSGNDYGTQVDGSVALIDATKILFRNNETLKAFKMHKKTIFLEIEKNQAVCNINLGYITDEGSKLYVYGNDTTPGFTMNLARFAVGSYSSTVSNSYTSFNILTYLIRELPAGYIGINNSLPGESAFSNYALATNAAAVDLGNGSFLNDFVESGRMIHIMRDYSDRSNARLGEIILDVDEVKLYSKNRNHEIVPIVGKYDTRVIDHLNNSVRVTNSAVEDLVKIPTDPSRIYIKKGDFSYSNNSRLIPGNLTVIDNSPEGNGTDYKIVVPKTITTLVNHSWTTSTGPKSSTLKEFLDNLNTTVTSIVEKDTIYSGYEDLGFKSQDLITTFSLYNLFLKEVSRRMLKDSVYIESVKKLPEGTTSSNQIDNFYNVPADGVLELYRDKDRNLYSILRTANANYTKSFLFPNFTNTKPWRKIVEEVEDVVTINNLVAKKAVNVDDGITTKKEVNSPTFRLDSITGKLEAKSPNIMGDTANLINYSGSSINDTLNVIIGDTKFKKLDIKAKDRPVWVDESGNSYPWLTLQDIRNSWNYRGKTYNSGQFSDLNSLDNSVGNGYYIIQQPSVAGFNYPRVGITGLLHNYKIENDLVMQVLFGAEDSGNRIFIRNKKNNEYGPWSIIPNEKDMDLKFDKAGGVITGKVVVDREIKSKTDISSPTLYIQNIKSIADSEIGNNVFGSSFNIISARVDNDKKTLFFGDNLFEKIVFSNNGSMRLQYHNGIKSQNIIVQDDLDIVTNNISTNYYTKDATNKLLAPKANIIDVDQELKKKVNKAGDTMTGQLIMEQGGIDIKRGTFSVREEANFNLAGRRYEDTTSYNIIPISLYDSAIRYDVVKLDSINEQGVVTLSVSKEVNSNINTPTALQFIINKDNSIAVNNIINRSVKGTSRTILMKDEIVDDWIGGANKVLSAERGKLLREATVGTDRGALSSALGVNPEFNIARIKTLQAGVYKVTTATEKTQLKLDNSIIPSNNGIFIVEGSSSSTSRSYRYITYTNDSTNQFVMAIGTHIEENFEWKYIYDISAYYTKSQVDDLLKRLKAELIKKSESSKFKFTGFSSNNSIPKKLIHTHNHESLGDSDTLYFKTNIRAANITEHKNFTIYLDGFSLGSSSDDRTSNFDIRITGRVEVKEMLPGLSGVSVVSLVPGTSVRVEDVKLSSDGYVTFSVKDRETNRMLSFDTYMRFSSIEDINFEGEILLYQNTPIN